MRIRGNSVDFNIKHSWLGGKDIELFPLSGLFLFNEEHRYAIRSNYKEFNLYILNKQIKKIVEIITECGYEWYCRLLFKSGRKGYENIVFNRNVILDNRDGKILFLATIKNIKSCMKHSPTMDLDFTICEMYYDNLVILINKNFSENHPAVYKDFIKHILPSYPEKAEVRYLNEIESSVFRSKKCEEFYSCPDTLEDKIKNISKDISLKIFGNNADIDLRLEEAINKKLSETDDPNVWKEFRSDYREKENTTVKIEDFQTLSEEISEHPIAIEVIENNTDNIAQEVIFVDDLSVETVPITFIDDLT